MNYRKNPREQERGLKMTSSLDFEGELILDGVLLDKLEQMDLATLTQFGSWLQAEGLQAIATRVSTGGECQIIIEDGRVKDAEEPPAPKAWTKGAF